MMIKVSKQKLQDEFDAMHKGHEDEVALRLKFESKLNQMHAQYRDLESRYKRMKQDNDENTKALKINVIRVKEGNSEIVDLKMKNANLDSAITQKEEELTSLQGQFGIK
jgi:chromosome segregation ATPase